MHSRRGFLKLGGVAAAWGSFGIAADTALGLIFAASSASVPAEATVLYPAGVRFFAEGIGVGHSLPRASMVWPGASFLSRRNSRIRALGPLC